MSVKVFLIHPKKLIFDVETDFKIGVTLDTFVYNFIIFKKSTETRDGLSQKLRNLII